MLKTNIKLVVMLSLAIFVSACAITEKAENSELIHVRSIEGIEEYQLSNGLKVLLYPDPAQAKTLVNITYRVGSVHEEYGETGMAHLLEHMLFKDSKNYKDIDKEFNKRGMQINATTWLDRTNYFEAFQADPDTLQWALGMEADRMINASFTADELASEMTVVRNEMERMENNSFRMLMARMNSTAYLWHNYANATIGARSDVENFPFQRLRAFYKKHYRPDNAVLTVAGRFDKTSTLELIKQSFGRISKPNTPIQSLYTQEPTQDGERSVNLRRVGEVPLIAAQYHVPAAHHPDTPAIQVLIQILSDSARGRLQKHIVEGGLASGQWAVSYLKKDPSNLLFLTQGFKGKSTTELEQELINLVETLGQQPVTEQDVEQAKVTLLKQLEEGLRNVTSVGMELSEYIALGDYRYIFYYRDLLEKVSVEEVQKVAETYLIESNRTVGRFIPTKDIQRAEIDTPASMASLLKGYKGRKAMVTGEVYDNTVSNIKQRIEKIEWNSGTELIVYPKKLRGEEVYIDMTLRTGNADSLLGYEQDFKLMGGLLFSGSKHYTKEQIASKLDELKAKLTVSSQSLGRIHVSIVAIKPKLDETLSFVNELLTQPVFSENEIEIDKKATITGLLAAKTEPKFIAKEALNKALNGHPKDHPLAYQSIEQKIDKLNLVSSNRLHQLHQQHLSFDKAIISVVGDVEPQQISSQLQDSFSSIKGTVRYQKMIPNMKQISGINEWIETPDKANAIIYIGHKLNINQQHPDYPALSIANSVFGGSGFASRLMQRIRVKEGYSYGTASRLRLSFKEPEGFYFMMAIAAPENMQKVSEAYQQELDLMANQGITQEELDSAVSGLIKKAQAKWADHGYLVGLLNSNIETDRNLDWFVNYEASLKQLTVDDVNRAFKNYISEQPMNVFAAGDFAKAGIINK